MGSKPKKQNTLINFKMILIAICLVVVTRTCLIEPFRIPSPSMMPTLYVGDHIFASKWVYGLINPLNGQTFVHWGKPKRGELIVFLAPPDPSLHYVKRVLGLAEDHLRFEGKDIYINDKKIEKKLIKDSIYEERFSHEKKPHLVMYSSKSSHTLNNRFTVDVPKDCVFVIGDNRDDSYDSRSFGCVSMNAIQAKVELVWWSIEDSPDKKKSLLPHIRWSRVLHWVY